MILKKIVNELNGLSDVDLSDDDNNDDNDFNADSVPTAVVAVAADRDFFTTSSAENQRVQSKFIYNWLLKFYKVIFISCTCRFQSENHF